MNTEKPRIEAVILGSGTSHGVPMIGCDCPVCTSSDARDKRTRPSLWIRIGTTHLLVDTAPELRLQCVANGIDCVDAVLFTHHHADHVTGLDDLRRFNWLMKKPMPCYGTPRTLDSLSNMFSYAFSQAHDSPHSRPELALHRIDESPFEIGEAKITPIPMLHGKLPVLGFRFGPFAYCTDCSFISDESFAKLAGTEVLVLDALRRTPHPAHFNLEQAVEAARRIGAARTYFTHITHQLAHEATNAELPDGMALAHDGLRIELP
ncbi:MAG: MBL fold metallo-hydrolase [Planctomycetes bacterium]|nr:MBL fold metallo-hydrolase [Planctomycetota bacterium]